MNISSAIVYTKDGNEAAEVAKRIDQVKGCEVIAAQDGKIVVVMSGARRRRGRRRSRDDIQLSRGFATRYRKHQKKRQDKRNFT